MSTDEANTGPCGESPVAFDRRAFLRRAGSGAGMLALADLFARDGLLAAEADPRNPLAPRPGHFPAQAKAMIWLFMNGGQSQVNTWDYKPELTRLDGQPLPDFDAQTGFFPDQVGGLMKSPFSFAQHGDTATWVSEIFPGLATHVNDLALIYSCFTETNNHSPALFQVNSGMNRMGFPCVGSWVTYGLGSVSESLPGFVVMYDTLGRGLPKGNALNWSAGFLPSVYQGTALNAQGDPIDNLTRNARQSDAQQRAQLDLLHRLNDEYQAAHPAEAELAARIESFELAYRMQTVAPEALAVERESAEVQELYGLNDKRCAHFARQCLIARRMIERGVRFVQIYSGGMENQRSWDGHVDIAGNHRQFAGETDQSISALLTDLKRLGLFDSTLVVCNGEFGRLPIAQKSKTPGRDHNPHAFTTWLAGAGVKAGARHGATDEFGFKAAVDRVSIHDLHATILHLLGLDHKRLTFRFNGRDFRLTDVAGEVIQSVVA